MRLTFLLAAVIALSAATCAKVDGSSEPGSTPTQFGTMQVHVVLPKGGARPLNAWIVVETRRSENAAWTYSDRLGGRSNGPGELDQSDDWRASLRTPAAIESRVLLCADGYATTIRPFRVGPEENVDLGDIVLDAGTELVGRVEDDFGRPVAGVGVDGGLPLMGFVCPGSRYAETDADGSFRLKHLARGEQILLVCGREIAPTYVHALVGGAAPVVCVGRGHPVRVTVVDGSGNPRAGVSIDMRPASADDSGLRLELGKTDATGVCEIRAAVGRWRIFAKSAHTVIDVDETRRAEARLDAK